MLTVHGHDPDGHGPAFYIPSQKLLELSPAVRQQWERIAVHMATAHRLRRHLTGANDAGGTTIDNVPLHAAAMRGRGTREDRASHHIRALLVQLHEHGAGQGCSGSVRLTTS